jgi:hypothetical protein
VGEEAIDVDTRPGIVAHEAGHCVAAYMLGVELDFLHVPLNGRSWGGAGGRTATCTTAEATSSPEAAERSCIVSMAGSEICRVLGVDTSGGDVDQRTAAKIASDATSSHDEAVELLVRALDRTEALCSSERFVNLVLDLCGYMRDTPAASGARVIELLRQRDPLPPDGIFETAPGVWTRYRFGRPAFTSNVREYVEGHSQTRTDARVVQVHTWER